MINESYQNLFVVCTNAKKLWGMLASVVGVEGPFIQLQDTIYKWWNADCVSKLTPLFSAIHCLILLEMWKMKNKLKHGEKMTLDKMVAEIDRNIHRIATVRYPWPRNITEKCPCLVRLLEGYKPCIVSRVIYRKAPNERFYKSTTNGASKGNQALVLVVSVLGIGKVISY